jgi:hypothetical protein
MSKIDELKAEYSKCIGRQMSIEAEELAYDILADLEELRPYEFTKEDMIKFADFCDDNGKYFTLGYKFELWQQTRQDGKADVPLEDDLPTTRK